MAPNLVILSVRMAGQIAQPKERNECIHSHLMQVPRNIFKRYFKKDNKSHDVSLQNFVLIRQG